jgi:hypothetical protein
MILYRLGKYIPFDLVKSVCIFKLSFQSRYVHFPLSMPLIADMVKRYNNVTVSIYFGSVKNDTAQVPRVAVRLY